MNCQEVMELMQRQLDDDLDENEKEVLMNHTRQCPDCAAMFARLQLLSAELTSLPKVLPSYSLVDAIMPQLERIELFGQPDTELPSIVSMTDGAKRRTKRERRWPSIRVMSGVIAAGIVAGLFLVTYNSVSDDDRSTSQFAANRSDNSASAMIDAPKKFSNPLNAEAADGGSAEVRTETIEKQDVSVTKETRNETSPSEKATPITGTSEDDKMTIGEYNSKESEGAKVDQGSNELGITTFQAIVVSPDGLYSGEVENFKVKVYSLADKSTPVFTSPRKNGELMNLSWSADSSKLTYEVHVEQGSIEKYVIDLATLKEKKDSH